MLKFTFKGKWLKLCQSRIRSLLMAIVSKEDKKGTKECTSEAAPPIKSSSVDQPLQTTIDSRLAEDEHQSRQFFDYQDYSTTHDEFLTWVDRLFRCLKLPGLLASALFAGLIFTGGLLIAWSISFHYEYCRSTVIHLGVLGIFWTCYFIHYGSVRIHATYEHLRPCFLVTDEYYKLTVSQWFHRFISNRGNVLAAAGLFILFLPIIYIGFFHPELCQSLKIQSIRPAIVEQHGWYLKEHLTVKALIIVYYAVFVALPLATGGRIIVLNTAFLIRLRKFPVVPLPNIIHFRLKRIVSLYLIVSLTWFGGVALFGVLLFDRLDAFSASALLLLSVLGILTFFTPQLVYRRFLLRSSKVANQWILRGLYRKFGFTLVERPISGLMSDEKGAELSSISDFSGFVQAASVQRQWIYNPTDLLILFIGQLAALASVYFQDSIKALLK